MIQHFNNQTQEKSLYVKRIALCRESIGLPQVRALRMTYYYT